MRESGDPMTFYGQQFLYLSDPTGHPSEVINGARTARGLIASAGSVFSQVATDAGCPVLALEPCAVTNGIVGPVVAGSAAVNSSSETLVVTTSAPIPAGATAIIAISSNPRSATTPTWDATDAIGGNTYHAVTSVGIYAALNTGVILGVIVGKINTAIPAGSSITLNGTITPGPGPVAVSVTYYTGVAGWRPASTGTGTGTATSTSAASGSCYARDLVIGMSAIETKLVPTGDSDTLGGAWSSAVVVATSNATDVDNSTIVVQSKVTTVAGAQTYGVGLASSKNFATAVIALVPAGAASSWQAVDFAASAAPWYRSTNPASGEALGFAIEEWTGLDGAHHQRTMQPIGSLRGGGQPGALSHKHRVMKINVLLHGTSDRGLTYLFRWLEQQLLNCCGSDGIQQLWWRETCPALGSPTEGLQMLNEVVLVEGPTWESQPTSASGCYIRRASFTLASGDPCMYAVPSSVASATMTLSGAILSASTSVRKWWSGTDKYLAAALPAGLVGRVGPVVTISSPLEGRPATTRKPIPDIAISGFLTPRNDSLATLSDAYQIGEIIIAGAASAGLVIEVNVPGRQVRYRDPYGDNQWYDGSRFIAAGSFGTRRWWSLDACTPGAVVVQPLWDGLACRYETSTADPVSRWTVSIEAVEINGCC